MSQKIGVKKEIWRGLVIFFYRWNTEKHFATWEQVISLSVGGYLLMSLSGYPGVVAGTTFWYVFCFFLRFSKDDQIIEGVPELFLQILRILLVSALPFMIKDQIDLRGSLEALFYN